MLGCGSLRYREPCGSPADFGELVSEIAGLWCCLGFLATGVLGTDPAENRMLNMVPTGEQIRAEVVPIDLGCCASRR